MCYAVPSCKRAIALYGSGHGEPVRLTLGEIVRSILVVEGRGLGGFQQGAVFVASCEDEGSRRRDGPVRFEVMYKADVLSREGDSLFVVGERACVEDVRQETAVGCSVS